MGDPSLSRDCPLDCKVYVGNLGNTGNKTELERAFGYYGPLRSVWVARNPPGFAFVEFEDARDAADAVRELDGRTLCGCRVRVEMSSGEKRSRYRGPPPSWNRRPRDDSRRRSPPARRRINITLPRLSGLTSTPTRETDRKERLRAYKPLDAYNYVLNGPEGQPRTLSTCCPMFVSAWTVRLRQSTIKVWLSHSFYTYGQKSLPGGRALAVVGAGPFPERGEERGLYLMIETINLQGLSQDHAVVHDPMVGNENCSSPALSESMSVRSSSTD
ncbi:serine/arginine-rich splicing factor 3b [Pimephales promelas]|nr:serine/arginine-rich splicing factor 3b [Pimephales promelas]